MKILKKTYEKVIDWSKHRYATRYLAALSFAEASFFPIPPDVMLAPMSMGRPNKAFSFATIAVLGSVIGGMFGYFLGMVAFKAIIEPFIISFGYMDTFNSIDAFYEKWGFLSVIIAGFTPIPYKLITIFSGVTGYNFPLFVIASIIGRSLRFYLVSSIIRFAGVRLDSVIRKIIDLSGWITVGLFILFLIYRYVI